MHDSTVFTLVAGDNLSPATFTFDPTLHGFRSTPKGFQVFWGSKPRWYKVTEKNDISIWYTTCAKVNPTHGDSDERWVFHSHAWTIGEPLNGVSHQIYMGCITNAEFATDLLQHLLGTLTNKGTKEHGTKRLKSAFVEYS